MGVESPFQACLLLSAPPDSWAMFLGALAVILLVSGLDDLIPILICVYHRFARRGELPPIQRQVTPEIERRIAIFVPCWKESAVIANMIRHNLAAIHYRQFDFFLGVYPNDEPTLEVAHDLAATYKNVHVAVCGEPGPTSKADCLNCIYHRMLLWEAEHGVKTDTVVLHDAEDLIHADALAVINRERAVHDMVQVPVLPLPTPWSEFTHGIYCDEFAEFQTIDMRARQYSKSFVPSSGVGTGFAREILERLREERGGLVFDPASLTEDYEIGVYIHKAGYSQIFPPIQKGTKGLVATREYFPRKWRSAIRQRTRWVTGISLQTWERHGWRGSLRTRYWFWRDRKGLVANPIALLTNALFLAGALDWVHSMAVHRPWAFANANPAIVRISWLTLLLQCFRSGIRMVCVARIFGSFFALGVPLRVFHGNLINCCASFGAIWRYTRARRNRQPLVWLKTEHVYPTRETVQVHLRELADVLVHSGYLSETKLETLIEEKPADLDLADFLFAKKVISAEDLCHAISLQTGVPAARIDMQRIKRNVVRSLPVHIEKRFGVVPFRVHEGRLLMACTRVPPASLFDELKNFTRLPIDFQLVTQRNYDQLRTLL